MKPRWLAQLSTSKAITLAVLWPVALVGLAHGAARVITWWIVRLKAGSISHQSLYIEPGGWPVVAAILLGPPIAFLVAWRIARR